MIELEFVRGSCHRAPAGTRHLLEEALTYPVTWCTPKSDCGFERELCTAITEDGLAV